MTARKEYNLGNGRFARFTSDSTAKFTVNNDKALHLVITTRIGNKTEFHHRIFTTKYANEIKLKIEPAENCKRWVLDLAERYNNSIQDVKSSKSVINDELNVVRITPSDKFKLSINEGSTTISIKSGDLELPICFGITNKLLTFDGGFTYTDKDFDAALNIYQRLKTKLRRFDEYNRIEITELGDELLNRTTFATRAFEIRSRFKGTELEYLNAASLDLVRSFIIAESSGYLAVNTNRLSSLVMNNFANSGTYYTGIVSSMDNSSKLIRANDADILERAEDYLDVDVDIIPEGPIDGDLDVELELNPIRDRTRRNSIISTNSPRIRHEDAHEINSNQIRAAEASIPALDNINNLFAGFDIDLDDFDDDDDDLFGHEGITVTENANVDDINTALEPLNTNFHKLQIPLPDPPDSLFKRGNIDSDVCSAAVSRIDDVYFKKERVVGDINNFPIPQLDAASALGTRINLRGGGIDVLRDLKNALVVKGNTTFVHSRDDVITLIAPLSLVMLNTENNPRVLRF